MEGFIGVLNIIDQYDLLHLKTMYVRDYIQEFKIVKNWLIENDENTDNKFVILEQIFGILVFCVYDIEKKTHKMISVLRENIVLSAVGYEICSDDDKEKSL